MNPAKKIHTEHFRDDVLAELRALADVLQVGVTACEPRSLDRLRAMVFERAAMLEEAEGDA